MFVAKLQRITSLGAAAALMLAFSATQGQGADSDLFDTHTWRKLCAEAPAAGAKEESASQTDEKVANAAPCFTYTTVRDKPTGVFLMAIGVYQVKARSTITALLPIIEAFPQFFVKINEDEPTELSYPAIPCDVGGCYVQAAIDADFIARMKAAKRIELLIKDVTGRTLNFPLSTDGFASVIDGPPAGNYDETKRGIMEAVRERLAGGG